MITFAHEAFREVQPQYAEFVYEYWHNSPENDDHIPLDFNWDTYIRLDADNIIHLTVGRDDDKMIAAALYLILQNVKHRTILAAHCDTFAVAREYRGKGIGKRLFAAVEPLLSELGVKQIYNSYREVYHTKPLFEKLGFELVDRVYMKKVD